MGNIINKKIAVDEETGEVIKEQQWYGYDGFSEKGYKYRSRQGHIKYFPDSIPDNLSEGAFLLLIMIAELMNNENVLLSRVERKSKFSDIIYKPMDKDEIAERLRFKYGINKFNSCWKELKKHCIKKIQYHDIQVWAVNPAVINKCIYTPIWLYEEFQTYMNVHITPRAINKLQEKIKYQNK